jgi:hypothetical protein
MRHFPDDPSDVLTRHSEGACGGDPSLAQEERMTEAQCAARGDGRGAAEQHETS